MKLIKANLFPIICGLVVLVSMIFLYYPVKVKSEQLRDNMQTGVLPNKIGLQTIGLVQNLETETIQIDDQPPITGPITNNIISERRTIQNQMDQQARAVQDKFIQDNAFGRVEYGMGGNVIPLLGENQMPGLLPNPSTSFTVLGDFRNRYLDLFSDDPSNNASWLTRLHAGSPPTEAQIDATIDLQIAQLNAGTPGGLGNNEDEQRAALRQHTVRTAVFSAAKSCLIYADPTSFQERAFVSSASLPLAGDIYEAFVDSWLQNDLVSAIIDTNADALNVGQSPVKRLIHIAVGADAAISTGNNSVSGLVNDQNLFVPAAASSQGFGAPGGLRPFGGASGSSTTMTGRVSDTDAHGYQVTYMAFSVVIEPWKINELINNLYRRNNGYTVLQISTQTVDPVEALSNGYVYGKVPVVRADILVEVLLFSDWNKRIMPQAFVNALNGAQSGMP
jgi:hypothetical protein